MRLIAPPLEQLQASALPSVFHPDEPVHKEVLSLGSAPVGCSRFFLALRKLEG
jgi:hypothetical protein